MNEVKVRTEIVSGVVALIVGIAMVFGSLTQIDTYGVSLKIGPLGFLIALVVGAALTVVGLLSLMRAAKK